MEKIDKSKKSITKMFEAIKSKGVLDIKFSLKPLDIIYNKFYMNKTYIVL